MSEWLMMIIANFFSRECNLLSIIHFLKSENTVKLGYNELGYNEHSVITNKIFSPKLLFYYINQPGYNEPRL